MKKRKNKSIIFKVQISNTLKNLHKELKNEKQHTNTSVRYISYLQILTETSLLS